MNILVCGDSHTDVFAHCNKTQQQLKFIVQRVGGATAYGCLNKNSISKAATIFTEKITNTKAAKLIMVLGEVDCNHLIWLKLKDDPSIDIDTCIDRCVSNLMTFLETIAVKYYSPSDIIVCGSILTPTTDCDNNTDRKGVTASQLERTTKTLLYNDLLEKECRVRGYNYIDITKETIGNNGVIDEFYINNNIDHHLNIQKTYSIWLEKLKTVMFKDCSILCSGPSSNGIEISTETVITTNLSILNNSINDNNDLYVIWFLGPFYMHNRESKMLFDIVIPQLKRIPNELHIVKDLCGKRDLLQEFKQKLQDNLSETKIYETINYRVSCGVVALRYGLEKFRHIYISGMECNIDNRYDYNKDFKYIYTEDPNPPKYLDTPIKPNMTHFENDKKLLLDRLLENNRKRIFPHEMSGLYKYMNI